MASKFSPAAIGAMLVAAAALATGSASAAQSTGYPSGNPRQLSARGEAFIKQEEGFRSRAYKDGVTSLGVQLYSIGYGHQITGRDGLTKNSVIDELKAHELFRGDVASRERLIAKIVRVPLTQGQFDALVSLGYNIGLGALEKSSLIKALNRGDYVEARRQFMEWTKGGTQNVGRRQREANLFATG